MWNSTNRKETSQSGMDQHGIWKNKRLWLFLIIVLAGVTRLYDMGNLPNGLHQDEAFVALNAFDLLAEGRDSAGHIWPVYMSSWGDGQSAMYIWLLIPFLLFSGGTVSLWLIRMPQLVISLLTVAAVYGIGKELWEDTKAGLLAAGLLAVCPWHFMMSRWALDANMAPGFVCFSLYFFIKGCKKANYLPIAAMFYGLSLYCYALTWLVIPILLVLQLGYGIFSKRIKMNSRFFLSGLILIVIGTPIFLYFLVNQGLLGEIRLPFMTIYKSTGYRGAEVATNLGEMVQNGKRLLRLLVYADTGAVWNSIAPWGLFTRVGLLFMALGMVILAGKFIKGIIKRQSVFVETMLLIQLIGGGVLGILVAPQYHQTNLLFIPLILLETYGIWNGMTLFKIGLHKLLEEKKEGLRIMVERAVWSLLGLCYAGMFLLFLKDYFGEYRNLVNAYFAEGVGECVEYAMQICEERDISMLTVEKGTQWPRILLYSHTTPSQFFTEHLVYDEAPAPWSYRKENLLIQTRIDYSAITKDSVYIIYFTDYDLFSEEFDMVSIADWYVAIPKK